MEDIRVNFFEKKFVNENYVTLERIYFNDAFNISFVLSISFFFAFV